MSQSQSQSQSQNILVINAQMALNHVKKKLETVIEVHPSRIWIPNRHLVGS